MTDITDASKFYLRFQNGSDYAKIEFEMNRFNPALHEDLEKPIKKGTIGCIPAVVNKTVGSFSGIRLEEGITL